MLGIYVLAIVGALALLKAARKLLLPPRKRPAGPAALIGLRRVDDDDLHDAA